MTVKGTAGCRVRAGRPVQLPVTAAQETCAGGWISGGTRRSHKADAEVHSALTQAARRVVRPPANLGSSAGSRGREGVGLGSHSKSVTCKNCK